MCCGCSAGVTCVVGALRVLRVLRVFCGCYVCCGCSAGVTGAPYVLRQQFLLGKSKLLFVYCSVVLYFRVCVLSRT